MERPLAWARRIAIPATLVVPLTLTAIVVLAAVVRLYDLTNNPAGFFTDEASAGYNAWTILHTGQDEHGRPLPILFEAFGEYKLPVFIYAQVPVMALLGMNELTVRLTTALFGIATVVAVYFAGSALFRSKAAGLAAAFFLAVMPWHIHFSRTGFGEMVSFPLFLMLGIYLFLIGRERKSLWLPIVIVFGLTFYTYRQAWVIMPVLLVLLAVMYYQDFVRDRDWKLLAPNLLLLAIFIIPVAAHFFFSDSERTQQIGIMNMADLSRGEKWDLFVTHYRTYFSENFLFVRGDNDAVTRHYLPGWGQLYYIQLPFIILGTAGLFWRPTREKIIVGVLLLLYPVSAALTDVSPISSRSIGGTVVFALLTGYGLVLAANGLARLRRPIGQIAAGGLVAAVLAITIWNFVGYLDHYHGTYRNVAADYWGWQYGPKQIIQYFEDHETDYDEFVMDGEFNSPQIFYPFYAPNGCEKCIIGGTDKYDPAKQQLFALRPKNMIPGFDYQILAGIDTPDGDTEFYLVEITGTEPVPATPEPSASGGP
jgi:4-amino-4-deoxy-L-arabinose transferase-like glycosyltransferase